jgi:hypothetical protein
MSRRRRMVRRVRPNPLSPNVQGVIVIGAGIALGALIIGILSRA